VLDQHAHGRPQVGELAGGVLVLAAALALAEPAVVEGQGGEPGVGQPARVGADDLLLHAGERSGQRQAGHRPVGVRQVQLADQLDVVGGERDPVGAHDPSLDRGPAPIQRRELRAVCPFGNDT
jgi:hypothetical protein